MGRLRRIARVPETIRLAFLGTRGLSRENVIPHFRSVFRQRFAPRDTEAPRVSDLSETRHLSYPETLLSRRSIEDRFPTWTV